MLITYLPLFIAMLIAGGLVTGMVLLSVFFGPKKESLIKDDPFECGTVATGSANERLSVKFYLVAVIFILFDIEIVFLYPWAVNALKLGWPGFVAMCSFLSLVVLALGYVWKRGVLDWA
jgi:NADH-quinone oxidoreductase subunit A